MALAKKPVAKKPVTKTVAKKPVARKAPAKKAKPIIFKAPAELKSHFVEVGFRLGRDSLMSPADITVEAIKGQPENEKAPRYDLVKLDPGTAFALIARLNYRLFAPNQLKRLPAGAEYLVRIRVTVTGDGVLRARVVAVWSVNDKGRLVQIEDKTDIEYRKIRMSSRFLAGAFVRAKDFVTLKEEDKLLAAAEAEDESDEEEEEVAPKRTVKKTTAKKPVGKKPATRKTTRK